MKHATAWLAGLALSLATLPPLFAGESTMTKDQSEIHAAVEAMTQAFMQGNIDRVMQSYEPGAAVVFEPEAPVADSAQLREMFAMMSGMKPAFTYPQGHEAFVAGDIGLHISPWTMTATGPDGSEIQQSGLSVAVFRRQEDGSWKMVIDNPHAQRLLP